MLGRQCSGLSHRDRAGLGAGPAACVHRTSTRGRSLREEGFIHASTAAQVLPVANAVYRDEQQDLILLVLDAAVSAPRSAASRCRAG